MVDRIVEQPLDDDSQARAGQSAETPESRQLPTAREFASFLFLSPGQREMAEQLDRDIHAGKFTGDMLAVARRLVGLTGDASYLLRHQNPIDLANTLYEIPPMLQEQADTAETLAQMEDPVVAAFANLHTTRDTNDRAVNSAHVALIRKGTNGTLRVDSPSDGKFRREYEQHALKTLQPPLPGGPSWGPSA